MEPICTVQMDDINTSSTDFVAVLNRPNGEASVLYHTDVIAIGMAIKVLTNCLVQDLKKCTPEELEQAQEALGDSFVVPDLHLEETANEQD